ncbi:MAG: HAD-IC family P-type ATPase [Alcanivorax sp.]|nr:HAD-IC family P-type ATPase [Alcanivorax sp.]
MTASASDTPATPETPWHARSVEAAQQACDTGGAGLTDDEVQARRARHGENRIVARRRRSAWQRLLAQFHNVLLYVLMAAALLALVLGYGTDALVIAAVVVINALVGFIQEGKAEAALRAIQQMLVAECLVVRDGHTRQIPADQLVPGDLVLLAAGDRVPADVRLSEVRDLHCDESMLTGESVPVAKQEAPVAEDAPLAERRSMAWMGALVTAGGGRGLVVATGGNTELGRIGHLVDTVETPDTPLTRSLAVFGRQLAVLILAVTALAMAWGYLALGLPLAELFRVAVGVAVAAIPEGLPAVVTITLAIGVQRMAGSRAVIRKLPAVEVLGSVTVICSDKTGTLTRNEMTTRRLLTAVGDFEVSGEGYALTGELAYVGDKDADAAQRVGELASRVALLCNDAHISHEGDDWVLHGDPTEGALYALACKAGLDPATASTQWPRRDVIPFATERLYMATLNGDGDGAMMLVKGAPERLLGLCGQQQGAAGPEPLDSEFWHAGLERLAGEGMRVLGLAFKPLSGDCARIGEDDVADGLIFVGLTGTTDPPRHEAIEAVAQCRSAGIRVKMITGDNPRTAGAIARQLGLNAARVLTGKDLADMDDASLGEAMAEVDVFARTSPSDKLRLVEILQGRGEVVAMTGDGVNDAPALQRADIGVAMGRKGTDAARDASAMVLTDDNFATIAAAVREGRTVYDNIVKAIQFILPTSVVQASVLLLALVVGMAALPITPVQILWVNMITAVTLALALAFEHGESGLMRRPPRRPDEGLVTPLLLRRLALVGVVGTLLVIGQFLRYQEDLMLARNMAVLTLVFVEIWYLFCCRRLSAPLWAEPSLRGLMPATIAVAAVLVLQWLYTVLPPMQALFESQALPAALWLEAAVVALLVPLLVEIDKAIGRRASKAGSA